MCDEPPSGPRPAPAVTPPAGYRVCDVPAPEVLAVHGAAARTLVGCPVLVRWPDHYAADGVTRRPADWYLGHVVDRAVRGQRDAGDGAVLATFAVTYCEDEAQPGAPTSTDYHLLSSERYGGVGGEMWYEARHFGAGRAA